MYNLLLVDDEKIALDGLSDYIDWENMGFHLEGAVSSIAAAKELIEAGDIHVVLTDIELEQESGLDLIKWVNNNYPKIFCVILTGHRAFEYAQRALRYGTFDFLVKPVQFDVLRQTFSRLKTQLENSDKNLIKNSEFLQLKKTKLFNRLITDRNFIPDPSSLVQLGIPECTNLFIVRICLMDKTFLPECTKKFLVLRLTSQYRWEAMPDAFDVTPSELSVIFYGISEDMLLARLSDFHEKSSLGIKIGISNSFSGLGGLYGAYIQAGQALDCAFWKHENYMIWYHDIQTLEGSHYSFSAELKDSFMECLESKDLNKMVGLVNQELLLLSRSSNSINLLYSFCIELLMFITRFLRNYLPGYSVNETLQTIRQLVSLTQPDDICVYLRSCLFSLWSLVKETSPHNCDILLEIQKYINDHYMDNISLQHLSEVFFLHPNYLSRLFKEKNGSNFIDYLTSVRIEKAKELLKNSDLKISAVSLAVGYETSKYFSSVFKEKCGVTPKEYRKARVND